MEDFKVQNCRLCHSTIQGKNYETAENIAKDILGVHLLKLDVDDEIKHVVCNICSTKLFNVEKFKLTCIYTDNVINSYATTNNTSKSPLDLKEIYENGRGNEDNISEITKICRLCMEPIKQISEIKLINEEYTDMILKFVPEMDIFIIKDPVMCKVCLDSLAMYCDLLKKCDVKQSLKNILNKEAPFVPYILPPLDTCLKIEEVDIKVEEDVQLIETESAGTIYEEIERGGDIYGEETPSEAAAALSKHETRCYKCNNYKIYNVPSVSNDEIIEPEKHKILPMCRCDSETTNETSKSHRKHGKTPINHLMLRKHPSAVQMYKCKNCTFVTKHHRSLHRHILTHKDLSQLTTYKCENCDFKSHSKKKINFHMLRHADGSEVQVYKCKSCAFRSRHRGSLRQHLLTHKNSSEFPIIYKCAYCNYETRRKDKLKKHTLAMHSTPLKVKTYKCANCNFQTKQQQQLINHMLIHKDASGTQMFKCHKCDYKCQLEDTFIKHVRSHLGRSEVPMYVCEVCNFETRYKCGLKRHALKHKDPSEVPMYKCGHCAYETNRKGDVKHHMSLHEDHLEVQMYKCGICSHETKYETVHTKHMSTHKDSSEIL